MTSKHLETFTDANFDTEVPSSELPVLVDFSAAWCAPCHVIAAVIEEIADDYAGRLRVGTLDVDANGRIATRYQIRSLPTLLVFRNGNVVAQVIGAVPRRKLDALLVQVL